MFRASPVHILSVSGLSCCTTVVFLSLVVLFPSFFLLPSQAEHCSAQVPSFGIKSLIPSLYKDTQAQGKHHRNIAYMIQATTLNAVTNSHTRGGPGHIVHVGVGRIYIMSRPELARVTDKNIVDT